MSFERGKSPKESMGIGQDAILKEIDGIILREDVENWDHVRKDMLSEGLRVTQYDLKNKNVIIGVSRERYTIIRNRFLYDGPREGDEKDLINVLLKLREYLLETLLVARDLIPVQPMSAPTYFILIQKT
jgi:hypothetical protein